jgi:hypothetical protein
MKAKRLYKVPLADRALEILHRCKILAGDSEYILPGRSARKPLSNMVFLMALRRMGIESTAHGFRSAFRDWANFPREVCEKALDHTIKDQTEAAYRRGDLLDKRRELMAGWNGFWLPALHHDQFSQIWNNLASFIVLDILSWENRRRRTQKVSRLTRRRKILSMPRKLFKKVRWRRSDHISTMTSA